MVGLTQQAVNRIINVTRTGEANTSPRTRTKTDAEIGGLVGLTKQHVGRINY